MADTITSCSTLIIANASSIVHRSLVLEIRLNSWQRGDKLLGKADTVLPNNHHKVTEIHNFSQDDLMTEDIFVLDCHSAIFVWVGQQVDSKMKMHALTIGELSVITEERDKYQTLVNELKKPEKDETGSKVANELQLSLAKKECCIKEMESSLNEQKEANNRQREEIKLLNERLNNEARRIKSLERESDRLRSQISLLESKLGHGDFSATSTKVLRMVNTLAIDNEAKQTIQGAGLLLSIH
ncbi:mitotic spindle checkpoint protein MAD1 [Eucalyptus grandis]|uniref:mitotic spindle checkpoint protein MAD1 n=1 Tax=Eucalyptus grandis TaxID=71139 RepID=UPI00192E95CB|nr:mitotic spindle checkpoint protein MAD1 [Eucalyptus grandis]